jgi:N-acetylneuraminate synthase
MGAFVIAEAGVNHNGSIHLAKKLIDSASEAGADAVKFQTFKTELLVSINAPKADYQIQTTNSDESQYLMLKKLELSEEDHFILMDYCKNKNIQFLSTPFDYSSLRFLVDKLDLPIIKISSGELTNAPFLLQVARTKKKVILSTGMSSLEEITRALGVLTYGYLYDYFPNHDEDFFEVFLKGKEVLKEKVTILHCTSEYPTPLEEVNLRAMDTLKETFDLKVGLSDHTPGIIVPLAAIGRDAHVIEKHFTLDKTLPGPDHKASLEPGELKNMIEGIRQIEKALGSAEKQPTTSEEKNKDVARKSLVAFRSIKKGETFTEDNISIKRPGTGLSPFRYWDMIGKIADRDYKEDELLNG